MPTKLLKRVYPLSLLPQKAVVTIGNFDGIHLGHQQLIKQLAEEASIRKCPSLLITFEPYPAEFFNKKASMPRLMCLREKWAELNKYNIDYLLILKFNSELCNLSAEQFVHEVLFKALHIQHLIVGQDFRFGKNRQGDITLLRSLGENFGFSVDALVTYEVNGIKVSSTRIREVLKNADFNEARDLLGRHYSMLGRVGHGDKLGRKLGFPTINIALHREVSPLHGIYTVYVKGIKKCPIPGVASLGVRPTLNDEKENLLLEIYLLDFNEDVYGQQVEVIFCKKLRDEKKFSSIELLKEQIAKDVELSKTYFKTNTFDNI